MYKEVENSYTYNRDGKVTGYLPAGVLVHPLEITKTDVKIADLSNGCIFLISRSDFDRHFVRIS
jgi:hypothetical protein